MRVRKNALAQSHSRYVWLLACAYLLRVLLQCRDDTVGRRDQARPICAPLVRQHLQHRREARLAKAVRCREVGAPNERCSGIRDTKAGWLSRRLFFSSNSV